MARPTSKKNGSAVNLYLSNDIKREASRVAFQFHGQASLSALVEKLLTREIRRRERAQEAA